jgi:hypothetical protein
MLTGAGYIAAKRTGSGTSELIRKFDPTAEETLFIPRLQAGDAGSSRRLSICAAYDFLRRYSLRLQPSLCSGDSKAKQPELSCSRGWR